MKAVIFGRGCIYHEYQELIFESFDVTAFLDNQCGEEGLMEEGIPVYHPNSIHDLEYDFILLMSTSAVEMREQLLDLHVLKDKILHYIELDSSYMFSKKHNSLTDIEISRNSVLLISTPIGYHGGAIAILNMAKIYISLGYQVIIHANTIDERFQKENRINNLFFVEGFQGELFSRSKYQVYQKFKYVVVNTLPLVWFAIKLSKYREVICWLHESKNVYREIDTYWRKEIISETKKDNMKIFAVSEMAKHNFEDYVGEKREDIRILPYGLERTIFGKEDNNKLTFAIIGTVFPLKQQVEFLRAYSSLSIEEKEKSRVFIIGKNVDETYYEELKKTSINLPSVSIIPELTRKELQEIYKKIDVVVVPSKQESLPIVAVEAMMNSRYVIMTNNSGLKSYISGADGVRLVDPNNIEDIKMALEFCIENKKDILKMARENKKIYEDFFSYEKFKKRMLLYGLCEAMVTEDDDEKMFNMGNGKCI